MRKPPIRCIRLMVALLTGPVKREDADREMIRELLAGMEAANDD